MTRNPYDVIKRQHMTEKARVLNELQTSESNPSVSRCKTPKYTFVVHQDATKHEIKAAFEAVYKDKDVKVLAVNTIFIKSKVRRRRGRLGKSPAIKKAIVTLRAGDSLADV